MRLGGAANAAGLVGSQPSFKRCVKGVPLFKGVERRRRAFGVPGALLRGIFRQHYRGCENPVELAVCDDFGTAL